LREPLEYAELDEGKPGAEIKTVDDFPNVVVLLSKCANEDQKELCRK